MKTPKTTKKQGFPQLTLAKRQQQQKMLREMSFRSATERNLLAALELLEQVEAERDQLGKALASCRPEVLGEVAQQIEMHCGTNPDRERVVALIRSLASPPQEKSRGLSPAPAAEEERSC